MQGKREKTTGVDSPGHYWTRCDSNLKSCSESRWMPPAFRLLQKRRWVRPQRSCKKRRRDTRDMDERHSARRRGMECDRTDLPTTGGNRRDRSGKSGNLKACMAATLRLRRGSLGLQGRRSPAVGSHGSGRLDCRRLQAGPHCKAP